jgi:hypothetical protein
MSAFISAADIGERSWQFRFGPTTDIARQNRKGFRRENRSPFVTAEVKSGLSNQYLAVTGAPQLNR